MKKSRKVWVLPVCAIAATAIVTVSIAPLSAAATTPTLTVNFASSPGGSLTGSGRGLLHGISPTSPDEANIAPLKPYEWRLGDPGYIGTTLSPAYDYFSVRTTVAPYASHETQVIMSDFIADPAYNPSYANPAATNWQTLCQNVASAVVATGQTPTFDLINEPDLGVDGATTTWQSASSTSWDQCYTGVRSVLSTATIAGPSVSFSSVASLETFLLNQKSKSKLPSILTWHFDSPDALAADAATLRSFMTANSITQIPMVLQEAIGPSSVGHPGLDVNYFAASEASGVTVGHACWNETAPPNNNTCLQPMLDGILNNTQTRRPEWYAYADYAAMLGNAVSTSSNDLTNLNGIASADSSTNKATVLVGANDPFAGGTVNVALNGLSSLPFLSGASSLRVAVQMISPGLSAGAQPVTSNSTYPIVSGSTTVSLNLPQYAAARLTITAIGADITDSAWTNVSGILSDSPAIASTGANNLYAFVRGSDGALYVTRYNGSTWAAWSGAPWSAATGAGDLGGPTGGTFVGAPSAVAWGGNVTVAVRGTDNALWIDTLSTSGTWSGWSSLSGILTSAPALASQNSSDLEAFARGNDGALWTTKYNGSTWSSWSSLGGTVLGDPTATSRANGYVTVYVRRADSNVYEKGYTTGGGWSSTWTNIGGLLTGSPSVSGQSSTNESVFGRNQLGQLSRNTWNLSTGWSGWVRVGSGGPIYGVMTGTPATVSRSVGHTDVIVWSADGPLYYLPTS